MIDTTAQREVETANSSGRTPVVFIHGLKNRGHALFVDSGWTEVADTALAFVQRFVN
jgi:hypothetical protein